MCVCVCVCACVWGPDLEVEAGGDGLVVRGGDGGGRPHERHRPPQPHNRPPEHAVAEGRHALVLVRHPRLPLHLLKLAPSSQTSNSPRRGKHQPVRLCLTPPPLHLLNHQRTDALKTKQCLNQTNYRLLLRAVYCCLSLSDAATPSLAHPPTRRGPAATAVPCFRFQGAPSGGAAAAAGLHARTRARCALSLSLLCTCAAHRGP